MTLALAAVAHDEGIDAQQRVVLVLDGAGWHTSSDLVLPARLDPVVLPATSPELQSIEPAWLLLNAPAADRTVADLEAMLVERSSGQGGYGAMSRHTRPSSSTSLLCIVKARGRTQRGTITAWFVQIECISSERWDSGDRFAPHVSGDQDHVKRGRDAPRTWLQPCGIRRQAF